MNITSPFISSDRPANFVYLDEFDPSLVISLRYGTSENFIGTVVPGYCNARALLTLEAAQALKKAQNEFLTEGHSLVVYDAYRPHDTVISFIEWGNNIANQTNKNQYYPYIDKKDVFALGYVASRSTHSRGSTVDVTLIKKGNKLTPIQEKTRTLLDGRTILLLDDGTIDMGSSFDLFDVASHYENNVISPHYKIMRTYLKNVMEKYGFQQYPDEWWHFTLENEPFPSTYFNFPIK